MQSFSAHLLCCVIILCSRCITIQGTCHTKRFNMDGLTRAQIDDESHSPLVYPLTTSSLAQCMYTCNSVGTCDTINYDEGSSSKNCKLYNINSITPTFSLIGLSTTWHSLPLTALTISPNTYGCASQPCGAGEQCIVDAGNSRCVSYIWT